MVFIIQQYIRNWCNSGAPEFTSVLKHVSCLSIDSRYTSTVGAIFI